MSINIIILLNQIILILYIRFIKIKVKIKTILMSYSIVIYLQVVDKIIETPNIHKEQKIKRRRNVKFFSQKNTFVFEEDHQKKSKYIYISSSFNFSW